MQMTRGSVLYCTILRSRERVCQRPPRGSEQATHSPCGPQPGGPRFLPCSLIPRNFGVGSYHVRWLAASVGLADLQTVFDPNKGAYRESSAENTDRPLTSPEPLIGPGRPAERRERGRPQQQPAAEPAAASVSISRFMSRVQYMYSYSVVPGTYYRYYRL